MLYINTFMYVNNNSRNIILEIVNIFKSKVPCEDIERRYHIITYM
jgi:hypothetical protein